MGPARSMLLGPASLDRYVQEGLVLPGGGALNNAYHLSTAGVPVHLLTRVGDDLPGLFTDFLDRHGIGWSAGSIVAPGVTPSIDIVIGDDGEPWMDNFVEGVWRDLRLTTDEASAIAEADHLHVVLVDPAGRELARLGEAGVLDRVVVSGDFLSFRRWDRARFAATLRWLDLGVIGWPGALDDATLDDIREVTFALGTLVVVTLGSRGVLVLDGRAEPVERFVAVDAVEVLGTSVGCGDAFIAAFLAEWWRGADVDRAVAAGARAGARATAWPRPLPDSAYDA